MNRYEPVINILSELYSKISDKYYGDIECLEDEEDRYTNALEDAVNIIKSIEQITWERDIAIDQLHELGYELGEKINDDRKIC